MININYKPVERLEDIATEAVEAIKENEYRINLLLAYELNTRQLVENGLDDVHEIASHWSAPDCPPNLYFNHGQYKKNGVENIINELKEKPSSNRAIYSLIDQNTIIESEDKPIPSFMLFQSILDEDILYCNVYLRALEIGTFLRINLEEIRLNIEEIHRSTLNFTKVRLLIIACRAHHVPDFNPLVKPELDLLSPIAIFDILTDTPNSIAPLIIEKSNITTVIDSTSIKHILDFVERRWDHSNKERLIHLLNNSISKINDLERLRKQHSHGTQISDTASLISEQLKIIAEEFRK